MFFIPAQIISCDLEYFPGWCSSHFTDVHGRRWMFHEKIPVVTAEYVGDDSNFPGAGVIACEVIERRDGFVRVDTEKPWSIQSEEGETKFDIAEDQLLSEYQWSK